MNEANVLRELLQVLGKGITSEDFSSALARLPEWLVDEIAQNHVLDNEIRRPFEQMVFPSRLSAECSEFLSETLSELREDANKSSKTFSPCFGVYISIFALSMLRPACHHSIDALIAYPEVFAQLATSLVGMDTSATDLCGRYLEAIFQPVDPELEALARLAVACAAVQRSASSSTTAVLQLTRQMSANRGEASNIWISPPLQERIKVWKDLLHKTMTAADKIKTSMSCAVRLADRSN